MAKYSTKFLLRVVSTSTERLNSLARCGRVKYLWSDKTQRKSASLVKSFFGMTQHSSAVVVRAGFRATPSKCL